MAATSPAVSPHAPHHLPREVIEARLAALPPAPAARGVLRSIVSRLPDGVRATPERTRLTPSEGVPGDAWGRATDRHSDAQITVMRHGVADVLADGRPTTLFGDNLLVELDLAADNMPVGRRWRVGEALLEVSPKPHNGCQKFRERFGPDALQAVQDRRTRHLNRRGVYWRVVEAGDVWVGAAIEAVGARPEEGHIAP